MLIRLQGYNFKMSYQPGKDNILADGLSRLPSDHNRDMVDLDIRVDLVQFSTEKTQQLQETTRKDPVLNHLSKIITTGWPEESRSYLLKYDHLGVHDGIIMKGSRVVIPKNMQHDILQRLHTSHLGQEKTKLLARNGVYWININKDIDKMVQSCEKCQYHQPSQVSEPLMQPDIYLPDHGKLWQQTFSSLPTTSG